MITLSSGGRRDGRHEDCSARVCEVAVMTRVLIVDSDQDQRRALALGLMVEGFEVAEVSTREEALALLDEPSSIDFVIIDLMIPTGSALELAREIHQALPAMRICLSSIYHLSVRQLERTNCGAMGFLPKPHASHMVANFLRSKLHAAA